MAEANNDIADLMTTNTRLLQEAFERGYRLGMAHMRDRILRAASDSRASEVDDALEAGPSPARQPHPTSAENIGPPSTEKNPRGWPPGRVARGTVRRVLAEVMSSDVGRTIAEITDSARAIDPAISVTSIPNELRRHLGSLYRQEGSIWFRAGPSNGTANHEFAQPATEGGDGRAAVN